MSSLIYQVHLWAVQLLLQLFINTQCDFFFKGPTWIIESPTSRSHPGSLLLSMPYSIELGNFKFTIGTLVAVYFLGTLRFFFQTF